MAIMVEVIGLTKELIAEAKKGMVQLPGDPPQFVFQPKDRAGHWFLGAKISSKEAKRLLGQRASALQISTNDMIESARRGTVFMDSSTILLQPEGRGTNWFSCTTITREEAMRLLKEKAREIKNK